MQKKYSWLLSSLFGLLVIGILSATFISNYVLASVPGISGWFGVYNASSTAYLYNGQSAALNLDSSGRVIISTSSALSNLTITNLLATNIGTVASPVSNGYFSNLFSTTSTITAIVSSTRVGLGDGTVALPSLYFNSDVDTGLYRIGDNNMGLALNGIKSVDFGTANTIFNTPLTFSTGTAVVAGNYWVGRNADVTNVLQFDVPTGASHEFSINDAVSLGISGTQLQIYKQTSLFDNVQFALGSGPDITLGYKTGQTPDALIMSLGADSNGFIITAAGNQETDHQHALQTNPTLFLHAAVFSTSTFLSIAHNGTDGVVGVGAGSVFLQGGLKYSRTAVATTTYTVLGTDNIIGVTYTATGAVSIILPTALMQAGKAYHIVDEGGLAGTNNITISTEGAELISGANTAVINANYNAKNVYNNGTDWFLF